MIFALVGLAGTVACSIAAIRASGETLAGPVGTLLTVVTENWVWLTVLSVEMTTAWSPVACSIAGAGRSMTALL